MFPATDLDNHLVEVPARTGARTAAAKIDGDQSAEFQEPASYGLVRYINATFGQQVLDITKRQGEPSVKPDRVLDNLRRKPMSLEGYLDHPETVAAPDRFGHQLNVSMPLSHMSSSCFPPNELRSFRHICKKSPGILSRGSNFKRIFSRLFRS